MCPCTKKKHDWRLIGSGFSHFTINCDIVCCECGKLLTVSIQNNKEGNKVLNKILENDNKFKIPKSVYVTQQEVNCI